MIFHLHRESARAGMCGTALHIKSMRTFIGNFHGRDRLGQGDRFFAYILLIIEFKGILMKLKNVACAIPLE